MSNQTKKVLNGLGQALLHLAGFPVLLAIVFLLNLDMIKGGASYGVFAYSSLLMTGLMAFVFYLTYFLVRTCKKRSIRNQHVIVAIVMVFTMAGLWLLVDAVAPTAIETATSGTIRWEDLSGNAIERGDVNAELLTTYIEKNCALGRLANKTCEEYLAEGFRNEEVAALIKQDFEGIDKNGYATYIGANVDYAQLDRMTIPVLLHLLLDKRDDDTPNPILMPVWRDQNGQEVKIIRGYDKLTSSGYCITDEDYLGPVVEQSTMSEAAYTALPVVDSVANETLLFNYVKAYAIQSKKDKWEESGTQNALIGMDYAHKTIVVDVESADYVSRYVFGAKAAVDALDADASEQEAATEAAILEVTHRLAPKWVDTLYVARPKTLADDPTSGKKMQPGWVVETRYNDGPEADRSSGEEIIIDNFYPTKADAMAAVAALAAGDDYYVCAYEEKMVHWTVLDMMGTPMNMQLLSAELMEFDIDPILHDGIIGALFGSFSLGTVGDVLESDFANNLLAIATDMVAQEALLGAPLYLDIDTTSGEVFLIPSNEARGVLDYMRQAWLQNNGLLFMMAGIFSTREIFYIYAPIIALIAIALGALREQKAKLKLAVDEKKPAKEKKEKAPKSKEAKTKA